LPLVSRNGGWSPPATDADDERKQGIEFGGNINVGIAIPF
jgi:hypothetical protein